MVRVNLIEPEKLADQHLVAEYDEILMLVAYIKKYPSVENIPLNYCLGPGHMKFFKNKVIYLKKRHDLLKKEMQKRGFVTNKTVFLKDFSRLNLGDWSPSLNDFKIIKKRLIEKLKLKSDFYRYFGEYKSTKFFLNLFNTNVKLIK